MLPPHLLGQKMVKVRNRQTTNQETHNPKVNENHKTKHNLLLVQFSVIDVCSEMQKLPLSFREKSEVKISGENRSNRSMVYVYVWYRSFV